MNTQKRGEIEKAKFQEKWKKDSDRFLRPTKRTKVQNFATENLNRKVKQPAIRQALTKAESLRDVFIRIIVIVADKTNFDLSKVLSYPIVAYPMSPAHCDGSRVKSDKSALLKKLESLQLQSTAGSSINHLPHEQIFDGGLLFYSTISQTSVGTSYSSSAR